jgi:hypothetical protein
MQFSMTRQEKGDTLIQVTALIMWSCSGNMPKYYPDLRDILPDRRVICLSDLSNILAYYLDKTTLISLLY